jgi:hypothetical protein
MTQGHFLESGSTLELPPMPSAPRLSSVYLPGFLDGDGSDNWTNTGVRTGEGEQLGDALLWRA